MQFIRQAFFIFIAIILSSCSVKKNTWTSRHYHTLTAYYNVYYNGNQAFTEGQQAMREAAKNDYTTLLPIYHETDKELARTADQQMDRAIEKGKKLIAKHSITVKPKRKSGNNSERYKNFMKRNEYNPMVDDGWLLMGKAHVVKHEHDDAIRILEFINREYEGSEARYEALIWLSKAYTNMEQYTNAQAALESYDLDGMAPESLYAQYMAAYANLLITLGKYAEALPYMEKATQNINKRYLRFRYQYILAQLYQLLDKKENAANAYRLAAKNNPDYTMSFNARINQASVVRGSAGAAETERALTKLMRDKKNNEYLDQIHYALGNLKLNLGEENQAINHYRRSIEKSSNNERQKGLTFLALGEVHYQKPRYIEAYEAYDSAVVLLSNRHPRFEEATARHNNLKKLHPHLITIRQEDSLLHLAQLPEIERMARIDQILDRQKQEQERKKMSTHPGYADPFFRTDNYPQSQTTPAGTKWYFYNVSIAGAGKMEFERRWGKRKNEDNWRRSEKSSLPPDNAYQEPGMVYEEPGVNQPATEQPKTTENRDITQQKAMQQPEFATKETLLAGIPISMEAKQKSHKLIEQALYEGASILNNQLPDHQMASQFYERLLMDYPNMENRENVLMGLYMAYEKGGNNEQALRLKHLITKEYPSSKFARYLNDPQFFEKLETQRQAIERHYEESYTKYLAGDYEQVIANSLNIPDEAENPYKAKYALIRALSHAKMGQSDPFHQTLKYTVASHPGTEESALAANLIKEIEKGRQPIKASPYRSLLTEKSQLATIEAGSTTAGEVTFIYSPYESHTALIVGDASTDVHLLQYNLADYNFGRYLLADYETEQKQFPDHTKLLLVNGLKNKTEAMDYLYTIREQKNLFKGAGLTDPVIVVVSDNNIKNLVLSGNLIAYHQFYEAHYLTAIKEPEKPKLQKPTETPIKLLNPIKESKVEPTTQQTPAPLPVVQEPAQALPSEKTVEPAGLPYLDDDGSAFSAIIMVRKARTDLRKVQATITNFTINNYGEELQGETTDMGTTHRVIKVTGFTSRKAAQEYIDNITTNSILMKSFPGADHHFFIINETNYQLMLENKDIKGYQSFINQQK